MGEAAGYTSDEHWGALYGLGIWLNVAKATALGLELVHTDLGRGSAGSGQNLVNADYSVTGAWLGGRFVPWQSEAVRLFVGLRLGLSLEHVSAYGLRHTGSPFESAQTFDCSGTHGPALGIAGGAGVVFRLNSRLDLVTRLDAHGEQLTSETIGDCAAGIGSTTNLSLGLGIAYGFDGPSGQSEPFARARRGRQTW
ncbi:MAG TPA: hypothetical protein VG937_18165 [Polyangiaceae bacterium]|nr:hypothetical protein [Polyangiaceae bacterium]